MLGTDGMESVIVILPSRLGSIKSVRPDATRHMFDSISSKLVIMNMHTQLAPQSLFLPRLSLLLRLTFLPERDVHTCGETHSARVVAGGKRGGAGL